MKTTIYIATSILIGGIAGSIISCGILAGHSQSVAPNTQNKNAMDSIFDQNSRSTDANDNDGRLLKDPTNLTQRDMLIAMWYAKEDSTVSFLEENTGTKFGPVWNRRNPIMILEEQLQFMKKFMAETDRLAIEQEPQNRDAIEKRILRESAKDPRDNELIDWQDYFDDGNADKSPVVWYGKSMKSKRWLAYTDDKGVYEPNESLMKRIIDNENPKSNDPNDPFSQPQK